jgi:hypothetical protein
MNKIIDPAKEDLPEDQESLKKLITFYATLLCTAHSQLDPEIPHDKYYRPKYKSHPQFLWLIESHIHYNFLFNLFCQVAEIYENKFRKQHNAVKKLQQKLIRPPRNITITKKHRPLSEFIT